jgi:hypothetical protein
MSFSESVKVNNFFAPEFIEKEFVYDLPEEDKIVIVKNKDGLKLQELRLVWCSEKIMENEKFAEWMQENGISSYDEAIQKFIEQVSENIDPRDYMTPTQREIADLSLEELESEYALVQAKTSSRSAAQRKYINQRYEHEQNVLRDTTDQQDPTNA